MTQAFPESPQQFETAFLGLASFLRMSIAGIDLQPIGESMLVKAQAQPLDANLWMNLSIIHGCLEQPEVSLQCQQRALALQRCFHLAAPVQPARLRLVLLMVPGDLAANTPLDCLLEKSPVDLDFYYLTPGQPLALPLPEHDALMLALSASDKNLELLRYLERELANWPKPVLNLPAHIPRVDRARASALLQGVAGLQMPLTLRVELAQLQAMAGTWPLDGVYAELGFPLVVRPVDSHGGYHLAKIAAPQDWLGYLEQVSDAAFFISPFIDFSHPDGYYRKIRIAMVDGIAHVCHVAVSLDWRIHCVSAAHYDAFWKREQELAFMTHFQEFTQRHSAALAEIAQRIGLDYVCLDCAESQRGELLVFEVDHAMLVHAMDSPAHFPYKQVYIRKVADALLDHVSARALRAGS